MMNISTAFSRAAVFILLGSLVCTYGMPVIFKDVMEELCSDGDDYSKLDEDIIPDVLALVKEMVGVLSTGLEKLKKHYIETRIHEEEACSHRDDYESPLLKDSYNSAENTTNEVAQQKLSSFYSSLVKMYILINRIMEEEHDSVFQGLYKDLLYHPEGGIVGMVCMVGPYVSLEERKQTISADLSDPLSTADHFCRDFNTIDIIYNSTLQWITDFEQNFLINSEY